jgi:hypothetical protein
MIGRRLVYKEFDDDLKQGLQTGHLKGQAGIKPDNWQSEKSIENRL